MTSVISNNKPSEHWSKNWRLQIQVIAIAAIFIAAFVVGLHVQQRAAIIKEINSQAGFRQARLDLAHGFLYITGATDRHSPFDRDQGYALLLQSLRQLRGTNVTEISASKNQNFEDTVENFQRSLTAWRMPNSTVEDAVRLRLDFHQLESEGTRIDGESQSRIRAFANRQEQVFLIGMISTLSLLAIAWVFVYQVGRSAFLAEQREEVTNQLLRTIVEGTSDGLFVKNRDGYILLANESAARLVGVSLETMCSSKDTELVDAKSVGVFRDNDNQVITTGKSIHTEETLSVKGTMTTYLVSKSPWRDANGEIVGIIGTSRDITKRKVTEQALRESEERYRRLIEVLPDAVFINENGKIVFCNRACMNLLGAQTITELLGKSALDIFDEHFHEVIRGRVEKMLANGEAVPSLEEAIVRLDGVRIPVSVVATPIKDRGVDCIMVAIRDLTNQKQIESQLRFQELLLQEAAAMAQVGGWGFDPITLKSDVTAETLRIYGFPTDRELPVEFGIGMYDPLDRPTIASAVQAAIEKGTPYDLELRLNLLDGTQKWVRSICNPVVENGVVTKVRGSIQDITDRKEAEAKIRQLNANLEVRVQERTLELEAANKELEAFSYSVSHDLRAPLRAIDGFSRIMIEEFGNQVDCEGLELLRDIRSNTQQMGYLVDDLLTFSRLSRQPLNMGPVDMAELVERCIREVQPKDGRPIEFHVSDLQPCVGDTNLLKQVWINLLGNAVKYSSKRDQAVIEIGCKVSGSDAIYFVKDNGVGFDTRYVQKLFGVFQRLHRAEDYEGNGVGLAIVHRIVTRHGGKVWAESQLDQGAAFFFQLQRGA